MKPDMRNIDEVVKRYMPSASKEDMESDIGHVFHKLQSLRDQAADHAFEERLARRVPVSFFRRRMGVLSAAAAALLVVFIGTIVWWPSRAAAVLESDSSRRIEYGEAVRANDGLGSTLVLADGSRVEMRRGSELLLERAEDGVRIRLNSGGVIVNAAEQGRGHLYVQTKDLTVSVVGTVFLVNAGEEGSRVAVIQGEVQVRKGASAQKLLPGEQVMTWPRMEWQPVSEEISWSRNAEVHLALLQQSVVLPAEPREAFDVESVRRSVVVTGGGERGGGGVRRRNPRPANEPCGSDREPLIDPSRFDASETTVHALISWAYGLDCIVWGESALLFGGPAWTKEDGFDILAAIPAGTPPYTADQFRAHNAPKLQRMLQTLLANRFKLVVHRETKEMHVYVLTVAKGGPKFTAKPVNPSPERPPGTAGFGDQPLNVGLQVWKEGDNPCCQLTGGGSIWAQKQSMASLAKSIRFVLGLPVMERTGLTGEFNFYFTFQPKTPPPPNYPAPDTRSIFTAIEQDLGLKLEAAKEKVDVLVIDRVERPSEN